MKTLNRILICTLFVFCFTFNAWAINEAIQTKINKIANEQIVKIAADPIVINAVKEGNKSATRSQEEINALDKKWMAATGISDWISGFLNNECAKYLKQIQFSSKVGELDLYREMFVMDKQGCVVAETNKTSDYWQGDEDKFIKSFNNGKGMLFIDKPDYDESTQTYQMQVSAPVKDAETGEVIGAITVGVNLDAAEVPKL